MLDCEDCHKWFHFVCAGIHKPDPDALKNFVWLCHTCEVRRWAEKVHADSQLRQYSDATSVLIKTLQADLVAPPESDGVAAASALGAAAPPTDEMTGIVTTPAAAAKGKRGKKGKAAADATPVSPQQPVGQIEPPEDDRDAPMTLPLVLRHAVLHAVRQTSRTVSTAFECSRQYALCQWAYDALVAWQHTMTATVPDPNAPVISSPGDVARVPAFSGAEQMNARAELRRMTRLAVLQWSPPTVPFDGPPKDQMKLGRPAARQMCFDLATQRPVAALAATALYRPMRPHVTTLSLTVSVVLKTLRDDAKPAFRTKALKVLAEVLDSQPALLRDRQVKLVVFEAFKDTAISVREAVTDLVGRYLLTDLALAYEYHEVLLLGIQDRGISVRKRVIKIIGTQFRSLNALVACCNCWSACLCFSLSGDVCVKFPEHQAYAPLCVLLLRRLHDEEESIQKTVLRTFTYAWFSANEATRDRRPAEANTASVVGVTYSIVFIQLVRTVADVVRTCCVSGFARLPPSSLPPLSPPPCLPGSSQSSFWFVYRHA